MGCDCEECCKNCCYSTPFLSLSVTGFTGVGLVGFTLSGLYGVGKMNEVTHLQNGTVLMAPVVSAAVVMTILPLFLVTFMAYCITGYIRDILFQSTVKTCIGSSCWNMSLLLIVLGYILLWLLLSVGFSGVMVYYVQARVVCAQRDAEVMVNSSPGTASTCLTYVDNNFNYFPICDDDLRGLCSNGLSAGLAFSISLVFALLVIFGLIVLLMVQTSNYISARDHIDYRENTRSEYDMKRVR